MKFNPTDEQINAVLDVGVLKTREDLADVVGMKDYTSFIRLYNGVIEGINAGYPETIHWRQGLMLAMKIGWVLREQAGSTEGLVAPGEEAEIEAMLREMQGGATA